MPAGNTKPPVLPAHRQQHVDGLGLLAVLGGSSWLRMHTVMQKSFRPIFPIMLWSRRSNSSTSWFLFRPVITEHAIKLQIWKRVSSQASSAQSCEQ